MFKINRSHVSLGLLCALGSLSLATAASAGNDRGHGHGHHHGKPGDHARAVTYAVIGDTPYGDEQVADLPNLIDAINVDDAIDRVVHVGDIKSGGTVCSDEHFTFMFDSFASFEYPVVYTPGDNEWTDCHRTAAGKYDPIERLEAIRSVFFANPFVTLGGGQVPIRSQAALPFFRDIPENQRWVQANTVMSTIHVVGSRNNLEPWFGDDTTDALEDDPERREAEVAHRTLAALAWLDSTFEAAKSRRIEGVLLFMQADTWPGGEDDGFSEIIQLIAERSVALAKPVLVIQGDSHVFKVDQPLLEGDAIHGVDFPVPNLTRLVVEGATTGEYLRLTLDPKAAELFSWERVQL